MSPYSDAPPWTVLGVSLPAFSLAFLRMSARARSRSDDSLVRRAFTSGGREEFVIAGRGRRGAGEEEDEEEASCFVMEVRGSCIDFRAVSRFLNTA